MARSNSLWISLVLVLFSVYHASFGVSDYSSCNFSDGMCGWTDYAGVNQSWVWTNSSTIDPGHDHTCMSSFTPLNQIDSRNLMDGVGSILGPELKNVPKLIKEFAFERKCYWLSTLPVTKFKDSQDFVLVSQKHTSMDRDGCFRFYYHFFGLAKATFSLQINKQASPFNATDLWAKMVPQGNGWAYAQVHVPKQTNDFYLVFKASLVAKFHDVVGIDDTSYSPYPCQPNGDTDFESGNQAWVADGVTIATGGDPIKDHTTNTAAGHYAISTNKQPSTLTAAITNLTRRFTSSEYNNCLKFYYRFIANKNDGDTDSYLEVNTTGVNYFDKRITVESVISDALENTWQETTINIPSYKRALESNYTVRIAMNAQKSTRIAIDDIIVLDKGCPSIGDCDFESDFCGWSQSVYTDDLWIRSDGANSASLKKSPKIDATTHTEKGWFALLPIEFLNEGITATLKSPPLGGTGSTGSCFQFAYYAQTKMSNQSILRVTLRDLSKSGSIITKPIIVNGTTYAYWANFSMTFPKNMPKRYSIEISTSYTPSNLESDIAIDDLRLAYYCGRSGDDPSTPKPTPIPYSEKKWNCDFQSTCLGWQFDKHWVRKSFSELADLKNTSSPPRVDHSTNSHTGRYLLYLPQEQEDANVSTQYIAILNSTNITAQPHCFSFYYFDASEVLVQMDIVGHRPTYSYIEKSIRPNAAARTWTRVRVDFQFMSQVFNISLVLHAARAANASFALDDMKLIPGPCQHMEDYTYTLDSLENMDINRIAPLRDGIGRIANPNYLSQYPHAPKHDHTTGSGGYFLFMNVKGDYNTTYKTELVIDNLGKMPIRKALKGRCIKFAYQIVGQAQLEVYVDAVDSSYHSYPTFRTAANHSKWIMSQTTYSAYYDHKITFVMEKRYDETSYIAIDDISFSDNCDRPIQCDFDDDLCSYNSDYNDYNYAADYEFARFVAPPLTPQWPGPGFDHTKQGYGGGYLYLTGYPSKYKTKRTALVQTPVMPMFYTPSTNSCISIFTYLTAPDAEVKVSIRFFSRDKESAATTLLTLTGLTETQWTRHYVDIDAKLFQGNNELIFTIEGTTQEVNTVIAIDDIDYSTSECSYKHQFKCKNGNVVNMDQYCNFKDDCKDNSDEADCGTCDFEIDDCGWRNGSDMYDSKLGGMWVPTQAGSSHDVPDKDGSEKKDGHFLLVKKSPYSDKNYKFVSGTTLSRYYSKQNYQFQFKDAYFTCYMTFVAYMQSAFVNYSRANIEVWAGSDEDSAVIKLHVPLTNSTNEWFLNAAFIGGFPHSFIVQFRASMLSENETVAIDNIKFNQCAFPDPVKSGADCPDERAVMCNTTRICISPADLCDFENNCGDNWDESYALCGPYNTPVVPVSCAFEKSIDTCGMTVDNSSKSDNLWRLSRGYSYGFTRYHLPSADHTTKDKNGQFMALNVLLSKNLGKPSLLYSPMMTSDDEPCMMRFFFYNNGDYNATTNNVLVVYAQYADGELGESKTLFSNSNYLATWNKSNAQLKSRKPFRFVFSGTINDPKGSISLDDISYTDTCYNSDATYKAGTHHGGASAWLIILLIALGLVILGGAFVAFRRFQGGQLSLGSIQTRVRSYIPGSSSSPTAFDNPHFSK